MSLIRDTDSHLSATAPPQPSAKKQHPQPTPSLASKQSNQPAKTNHPVLYGSQRAARLSRYVSGSCSSGRRVRLERVSAVKICLGCVLTAGFAAAAARYTSAVSSGVGCGASISIPWTSAPRCPSYTRFDTTRHNATLHHTIQTPI
jgi:hypothetical protein